MHDPKEMVERLRDQAVRIFEGAVVYSDNCHDALVAAADLIEQQAAELEEASAWNEIIDRHGTDQFDDLAEKWLSMVTMQRFFQAHCSTFSKWADDQLLARYRQSMADMIQLAFVEGALAGVRAEIAQAATDREKLVRAVVERCAEVADGYRTVDGEWDRAAHTITSAIRSLNIDDLVKDGQ